IDPGCDIPDEATAVHGIRNRDVAGKPTIAETLPRFLQFLGDAPSVMMAHNAGFDMGFLAMAWGRLRQSGPSHTVVDTIPLARERLPLGNYKLETIGRHLGLIDRERHRALDDSVLLKNVFLNLVEREPTIATLAELFDFTPELSFQQHEVAITHPPLGFEELAIAISEGQSVKLVYDGGTSPGSPRIVTPLAFVKEGGRIYLSALCHKSRIEKWYRLDRIISFESKAPSISRRKSSNRSSAKGERQKSKPKPDGHG
ncbi:MAG: polymerase PolC-type, partial [Planctomycetota bacterium]